MNKPRTYETYESENLTVEQTAMLALVHNLEEMNGRLKDINHELREMRRLK